MPNSPDPRSVIARLVQDGRKTAVDLGNVDWEAAVAGGILSKRDVTDLREVAQQLVDVGRRILDATDKQQGPDGSQRA